MRENKEIKDDQHIMIDEALLDAIVEQADLGKNDIVLEIGGGPGNLAKRLVKACGKLTVVEKDAKYAVMLEKEFSGDATILHGDILDVPLPEFNKIVSNTPYSILQQFFVRLVKERKYNFERAVLVVPRGFTAKITALPGSKEFGYLSALFTAFYEVNVMIEIDKSSFKPPPRVKSDCVRITRGSVDPQRNFMGYVFREIFLNEDKKVKNILITLFWDYGKHAVGKEFTKNEAQEMAQKMLGDKFLEIGERRLAKLRNDDFSDIANAVARSLARPPRQSA